MKCLPVYRTERKRERETHLGKAWKTYFLFLFVCLGTDSSSDMNNTVTNILEIQYLTKIDDTTFIHTHTHIS